MKREILFGPLELSGFLKPLVHLMFLYYKVGLRSGMKKINQLLQVGKMVILLGVLLLKHQKDLKLLKMILIIS
jgi:hypothetical protein